ncbi:MAG: hypothetical protein K2L19_03335 [Eubacterium sp.]|nr:hypothetical protein [Eubacterium sp.]
MDSEAEIKFNRAYEMYFVMLYKIAFLYTGSRDDSEDILQEVFMKYLYKSPSFKDNNHEKAGCRKRFLIITLKLSKE